MCSLAKALLKNLTTNKIRIAKLAAEKYLDKAERYKVHITRLGFAHTM